MHLSSHLSQTTFGVNHAEAAHCTTCGSMPQITLAMWRVGKPFSVSNSVMPWQPVDGRSVPSTVSVTHTPK